LNELECGPMPNVMAALLTPATEVPCSNAAKMRNQLKLAGMPQTTGPISAASGPKFTILWGIWRRYCFLTSFFPIVDMCLSCEDIARQSCMMVHRWRIFGDFLRGSMVDIQSPTAEIRQGKKDRKTDEETTAQKYNGLPYSIGRP